MSIKTLALAVAIAAGTVGFTSRADAQVLVEPTVSTSYYAPTPLVVTYSGPFIHYPDPSAYYSSYPYYLDAYAGYYPSTSFPYNGYYAGGFYGGYGWSRRGWRR